MGSAGPNTREDAVYVLIVRQRGQTLDILTVLNRNGAWSLPGGLREVGETLAQAAVREAREECGVAVDIGRIVHVSEKIVGRHDGRTVMWLTFMATIVEGEPHRTGDAAILDVAWKPEDEVIRLMPWHGAGIRHLLEAGAEYLVEE